MLDASGLKHALSACLPLTQPSCVALFGVSLAPGALTDPSGTQHAQAEGPKVSGAHTVCEAEVGQGWSPAAAEVDILVGLMQHLRALGVRVVACQKVIHERVQHAALQLGMVPLQRLSAQHATSLSSISGALPINSWHPPVGAAGRSGSWKHMLGVLGGVDFQAAAHRPQLILRPVLAPGEAASASCSWACQAPGAHARLVKQHVRAGGCSSRGRVQTLLLGAATQSGCDELRTAAEGALRVLAWTLRSPWVLPGGGAWQGLVAARIRAKARALQRRRRHVKAGVYTAMAGALEQVATSLVPHSTGQAQEVGEGVRSAARSAAKQLANSLSSGSAAASPSRIPATHVEYIGWGHALTQLVAVAVVEVHAPNLGAQPSSGALAFLDCPPAQHFPTSLHAQTAGTQGSSPPEGPLQMPKGSRLMKTGYDFRRTPKASRMLGAKEETCDGRSDVGFHVQPLMSRCRGKLVSAHLLDSAPAMMGALASGVDAACMLLRVDALVAER
mmetsp:Transcript_8366/g.20754  ORF Transcript_8366/g.20754 Transcript_8366/m.20754 type:complete len:502 (+) Transcript_8366:1542-3047(+)